jgi:putative tricarboxylic transport membrane protein
MPRDAVVGGVILAFAGLYWLAALTIRHSSLDDSIGAAGLPNMLAALLAALAVLLILRSFLFGPRSRQGSRSEAESEVPRAHLRALGMLVFGVAYLVVVPSLGYAVSVALLVAAVALYNHQRPSLRLALVTILISVGFYLLFVRLLRIPLPPGVWPDFLPA